MSLRKIYYTIKMTQSNNTYVQLLAHDQDWLITKLIQMNSLMSELSLSNNRDVRDLIKYWTTSNRTLPFNSFLKKHNSPSSFVAGLLNNTLFGHQRDLSEIQIQHIQNVINQYQQFADAVEQDLKIYLQRDPDRHTVAFVQQLFD